MRNPFFKSRRELRELRTRLKNMWDEQFSEWALVSGYVSEMVVGGSDDAADILRLMYEVRPITSVFIGPVEDLIAKRGCPDD